MAILCDAGFTPPLALQAIRCVQEFTVGHVLLSPPHSWAGCAAAESPLRALPATTCSRGAPTGPGAATTSTWD
ncbi:hypothetical protein AB0O28_24945 [Microbispora sp. NPDC088329]|uniref:hypothetical protein n=1 Tax=Microbispora sp. NPDC088329 TaxID=3154869 RepID=UPI0034401EF8